MSDQAEELIRLLKDSAIAMTLRKAVFSSPRHAEQEILRANVRPVELRGQWMLQFTTQTATQQFHQNLPASEAAEELARLASKSFRNTHLTTDVAVFEARMSRRGKCFLRKETKTPVVAEPVAATHNRKRNYLIPEGVPCPFLIHTGVMTKDGVVRANHSKKFGQINRFLEFINDVIDILPSDRTIQVVDFGCGKSYLTFATQYLLTTVLKRDCRIIGLDRRPDVVQTCSGIVAELKLANLQFFVGDIASFSSDSSVDLVISLHACDTATDDALAQAVGWKSQIILAVPCCQHELNGTLSATSLAPLTSFGLTKERFASLATDTMRAALMTAAGYQTQIVEFIDMEHTPKNILIRCVRRPDRQQNETSENALQEVINLRTQLGIPALALERQLMIQSNFAQPANASDQTVNIDELVVGGNPERSHAAS